MNNGVCCLCVLQRHVYVNRPIMLTVFMYYVDVYPPFSKVLFLYTHVNAYVCVHVCLNPRIFDVHQQVGRTHE